MSKETQTKVENKSTEATFPKTTLAELGNQLPVHEKGKTDQYFTFIEWGTPEEKKIAKIKEKNPNMGYFVSQVLMLLLDRLNGIDFHGMEDKMKILALNQMRLANPLYMYFYLRFHEMGEHVTLGFQCPNCRKRENEFIANLGHLDVDCKCGEWPDHVIYKLVKPITLAKGEQLIDNLKLKVGLWDIMEKMDLETANDEAETKIYTLKNHIDGSEGFSGFLDPQEIVDKIKKTDLERTQRVLAAHNAGPAIRQEIECPKCRFKFNHALDWSYDHFFGASSLPQI